MRRQFNVYAHLPDGALARADSQRRVAAEHRCVVGFARLSALSASSGERRLFVFSSSGNPIYVGLVHDLGPATSGRVAGDIDMLFRVHASVPHKAFYGLNVTNSLLINNTGSGVAAINIRDRFALCNVSVDHNEGHAGVLVRGGAADLWLNDTSLSYNWGDGLNVSYAGGSINVNTSRIVGNRWRGE